MRKSFNLSDWALDHRSLVWYFMLVAVLAGAFSFVNLGREEDPSFTIKTMVIQVQWPGATAQEITDQVTDRIEKKLQELPELDYTKSMSMAGKSTIMVNLLADTKSSNVQDVWFRARNMINDITATFPQGVIGPFYQDTFGDVFGNIYAFTSDGLSYRQLLDYVEDARSEVLSLPNSGKVDILGAQDEVVYLEFSPRRLAAFGLDQQAMLTALQEQNAITPSGVLDSGPERIAVRVTGQFSSEDSLRNINFHINDQFFRLSDVATVTRGYEDPPTSLFRFNGQRAIALAVGMKPGANLLDFGKALDERLKAFEQTLPVGVNIHLVADQPAVVEDAVSGFTRALFEAVVIVLIVSFVSLGMRAGVVVAIAIPLVLALTFMVMEYTGITLQRISLGALIISLGLLVDDAMIAVEMMVARLEAGDPLRKAATAVYTSTAFPMLTGTLVTAAGFIPIGLNSSAAGEYTFTMFVVISVSLLISWIVAVLFTPLIGVTILPEKWKKHHEEGHQSFLMRGFKSVLIICMQFRWLTVAVTVAVFAVSLYGMTFVQQQFFPSSERTELLIDFTLPQNASINETNAQIAEFEKEMLQGNEGVEHWSTYVGSGAPRFVLTVDVPPAAPFRGEVVVITKNIEVRDRLKRVFQDYLDTRFPNTDALVKLLELGPPVGRPVQYRVSGRDEEKVRQYAMELKTKLQANPNLGKIVYDWGSTSRVVKVDVLQDRAHQLGVSSKDIATALNGVVGGMTVTQLRDATYLINVEVRAQQAERMSIDTLENLQLPNASGVSIPLSSIARFEYTDELPVIWRRNRLPTINVAASVESDRQPVNVVQDLAPTVNAFAASLPAGYHVDTGGVVENSEESQAPIIAVVPVMLFIMATVLMIQLQSFGRLFLVTAVAPLGLIGVVAALLPSGAPLGFVAILGVLALIGILIRNSVILIVQIEDLRKAGEAPWDAVVNATLHRLRPIMLTALAASLGLIPIAREVFWGPMAYAMMGGIIIGTLITLLFLPALYVGVYRIRPEA
ncbi:efflux RND transporter permease subunit [Rhizobium sp. L1K21]|uniref:efflux RND transporter permease subunit n=1 Tax=Rhizobium sp. L1K21 TaxID=2954933 RepID=UPI0020932045|nr:efflux RND transporter permease subunit [Rhizobium sp. L1K21]MCO6186012.1 efflux RND transporter permease subunit [Rhizobium sp. L1K21]